MRITEECSAFHYSQWYFQWYFVVNAICMCGRVLKWRSHTQDQIDVMVIFDSKNPCTLTLIRDGVEYTVNYKGKGSRSLWKQNSLTDHL
jgi:hypothetical protein